VLKSFFKDTIIYGVAAVLPRIINLALIPIITSVLGTVDFSDMTTWYVYAAFINVVLTMGIETSFFRFYTTETERDKVLSTSSMILLGTSALFLVLGTLVASYAAPSLGFNDPIFIQLLVIITVLDTIAVMPFALLRISGRPLRYMYIKMFNILVLFVLTTILLLILPKYSTSNNSFLNFFGIQNNFKPGVIHIIIPNLAASMATILLLAPELWKIKWTIDKVMIKKLLKYGWPIMIGGIAYSINENMDKLLIQRLIDKDANGVYAACYKLGVFMTLYITAFRLGAEPFFFKNANAIDAKQKYSNIMTWFVIFGSIFMLFVVGFIDILASIIIRDKVYLSGLYIVPVILLANLFSGIYNNLSIWYKLTDRTRFGMYISIAGAFITVVNLLIFVPFMGIMGGAIATLFTYVTMATISYFLGHRYYPMPYQLNKIFVYISIATVTAALSFLVFRGNIIINIFICCSYLIFIFLMEREQLKSLLMRSSPVK
jgi:O-antigen/teichoic acid export membrane protein